MLVYQRVGQRLDKIADFADGFDAVSCFATQRVGCFRVCKGLCGKKHLGDTFRTSPGGGVVFLWFKEIMYYI
jgi:hypothetical protein